MQIERNIQPSEKILILADFTEGNWTAIQFAMKNLYQANSEICIVQTWQKTNFGFSMIRDLGPILQDITKRELEGMKINLLKNFKIDETQITLYPFEGDLPSFFKSELYKDLKWQVVMAPGDKACNLLDNPRITEIVDEIKQPLYILMGTKENAEIQDVNVFTSSKKTSNSIVKCFSNLSERNRIAFRIYLDASANSVSIIEACKKLFSKVSKASDLQFYELENSCSQQIIEKLPQENGQRLLIFDENFQRKYNTNLKSSFDSWFVKSKGISVGMF